MEKEMISGACHCGAVQFQVTLRDGWNTIGRCNCSFCEMRGAVAVSVLLADMEITQGADQLTLYQFNTKAAQHHFCKVCGIYTHHQRRSDPSEFGVNVACLDGVSPFDFERVPVGNGRNHPSDGGDGWGIAGHLRFEADI